MRALFQDLLLSVRSLRREPTSAIIASVTLALGIGLCTIAFSLLFGVFLRGHPVPQPDRLLLIARSNPSRNIEFMSVREHDFYDWRAQQKSFEMLAHFSTGTVNLAGREGPERFQGAFVSANVFDALRILERNQYPDFMNRYLTNGTRSIPMVIALDLEFRELGHWGPRPAVLQEWMLAHKKTMPTPQRYTYARGWYARDKGESTLRELLAAIDS